MKRYALYFAWLIASLGVLTSLYFSAILNYEPCHLCWYQRLCLFPLALLLGIATYRSDTRIIPYALPFAFFGLCFSTYQILIQQIPGWMPIDMCGGGPSCSEIIDIGLGPITLPMLSAFGFVVIGLFLFGAWSPRSKTLPTSNDPAES